MFDHKNKVLFEKHNIENAQKIQRTRAYIIRYIFKVSQGKMYLPSHN